MQKGSLQQHQAPQPSPGALFYTHDGVAVYRNPVMPAFYQQPAGSNVVVPMSRKLELKAGSRQHQHIVAINPEGTGTKLGLVALDLPIEPVDHEIDSAQCLA